jgi:hypothetical protein
MGKFMKGLAYSKRADHWDEIGCVEDTDPVEAVTACNACLKLHCPALSTLPPRRPRVIRVRTRFDPNADSQRVDDQADGQKELGDEEGG